MSDNSNTDVIWNLNVMIQSLEIQLKKQDKEIERLNNIIKEVREFVERYLKLNLKAFDTKDLLEKILETLDKGE